MLVHSVPALFSTDKHLQGAYRVFFFLVKNVNSEYFVVRIAP